jgi:casein kinase I family protein HRR25
MGSGTTQGLVNVIDFGLAKRFRDPRTEEHVPYAQEEVHGTGTSLFASLNTHDGIGEYDFSSTPGYATFYGC